MMFVWSNCHVSLRDLGDDSSDARTSEIMWALVDTAYYLVPAIGLVLIRKAGPDSFWRTSSVFAVMLLSFAFAGLCWAAGGLGEYLGLTRGWRRSDALAQLDGLAFLVNGAAAVYCFTQLLRRERVV